MIYISCPASELEFPALFCKIINMSNQFICKLLFRGSIDLRVGKPSDASDYKCFCTSKKNKKLGEFL